MVKPTVVVGSREVQPRGSAVVKADGYKLDHRRQYPGLMEAGEWVRSRTQRVLANWTARGSRIPGVNKVTFVGLQAFIIRYLMQDLQEHFFNKPFEEIAERYTTRVNKYLGPNKIGVEHIRAWHALGYTPLEFYALPEGTNTPIRVPMFTVCNSEGHEEFYWLVNYFETLISSVLWGPCTSATQALRLRRLLEHYARITGTDLSFVDFQGHDFSERGMFGFEAGELSGLGHLVAFIGTDTLPAIDFIEEYFPGTQGWIGASVAATEHSVVCAGGKMTEEETVNYLIDLYPTGIVSSVSDTWDLWNMITVILRKLKDRIMARDGKFVVRPDSGDPVKIVCGDPNAPEGSPQRKGVVELLWEIFGGTTTSTGHKLLDSHIGVIYGDAISYSRAEAILAGLAAKGFASGNIVFGVGSYTYQYVTRDTFGFAMKSTWAQIDGEGQDLFKQPVTDDGVKNSAKGRLAVLRDGGGELYLVDGATPEQEAQSELKLVWRDGMFHKLYTFDEVRATARMG